MRFGQYWGKRRGRESPASEAGDAHRGRASLARSRTRLALNNPGYLAMEDVVPVWGHYSPIPKQLVQISSVGFLPLSI